MNIYTRSQFLALAPTDDRSKIYWRKEACKILFSFDSRIDTVEIVPSGCKTDSAFLKRGDKHAPIGTVVILASTGGKYGHSRQDYWPQSPKVKTYNVKQNDNHDTR